MLVWLSGLEPYLALAAFPQGSCQTGTLMILGWALTPWLSKECFGVLYIAVSLPSVKLSTTITGSKEERLGRTQALCSTGCIAGQQTGFELLFDMDSFNYLGID